MEGLVLLVNGAEEARAAVRKLVKDGVEWVKTYPTGDAAAPDTNDHHTLCMTFEEMHAVVQTAHNHRLKVTGHCRATEGIKNALRAGYDTLEHGTFMDDEALDMLLARNTPVIPALQFEHASIVHGPEFGMPQPVIDGHQETLEGGAASALRILRAGGRVGMGGDYGFAWNPHGTYAKELTFFVKYVGFSPLETITCATKTGAEIMGREKDFGTLEAGRLADLLVVAGDVRADISLREDRDTRARGQVDPLGRPRDLQVPPAAPHAARRFVQEELKLFRTSFLLGDRSGHAGGPHEDLMDRKVQPFTFVPRHILAAVRP